MEEAACCFICGFVCFKYYKELAIEKPKIQHTADILLNILYLSSVLLEDRHELHSQQNTV
jgi:hypothetical protein